MGYILLVFIYKKMANDNHLSCRNVFLHIKCVDYYIFLSIYAW